MFTFAKTKTLDSEYQKISGGIEVPGIGNRRFNLWGKTLVEAFNSAKSPEDIAKRFEVANQVIAAVEEEQKLHPNGKVSNSLNGLLLRAKKLATQSVSHAKLPPEERRIRAQELFTYAVPVPALFGHLTLFPPKIFLSSTYTPPP